MNVVLDTSALIQSQKYIETLFSEENKIFVVSVVADELDNQKESSDNKRAFNGRTGLRFIENNINNIEFYVSDIVDNLPENFDKNNNDNKIISSALKLNAKIVTKDRGMKIKASSLGVECIDGDSKDSEFFKGYKNILLDTSLDDDNDTLASIYDGTFNLFEMCENEYLIIKDKTCPEYILENEEEIFKGYKTIDIVRYHDGKFIQLKLPPKKVVNPMNDLQRCALDLLNNDDCPIKIIAGGFGSGKTMLSTKMAIHKTIEKGIYGSILALRNPSVEGEQVGFLPGTKEEKTNDFFNPFVQHLEGKEFEAESLIQRGQLKKEIIGYIKGLSIGQTFIIVDEAEDLNLKQLKMCGSRIEKDSCICFVGDYKQTHDKFVYSSGLLDLIELTKESEYVGVVVLEEDLRSPASRVFANI